MVEVRSKLYLVMNVLHAVVQLRDYVISGVLSVSPPVASGSGFLGVRLE